MASENVFEVVGFQQETDKFKTIALAVPDELKPLVELLSRSGSFIAGGTVRAIYNKEKIRDIDVFTKDINSFAKLTADLIAYGFVEKFTNAMLTRFTKIIETGYADKQSIQQQYVQIVDAVKPRKAEFLNTQGTPEEVLSFFDFTVCRAALTSLTTALVDVRFEDDCKNKRLHVEHIVCPLALVRRIGKYVSYGYSINLVEIAKLFTTFQARDNRNLIDMLGRNDLTPQEREELMKWVYVD